MYIIIERKRRAGENKRAGIRNHNRLLFSEQNLTQELEVPQSFRHSRPAKEEPLVPTD